MIVDRMRTKSHRLKRKAEARKSVTGKDRDHNGKDRSGDGDEQAVAGVVQDASAEILKPPVVAEAKSLDGKQSVSFHRGRAERREQHERYRRQK
jgi:hypothetical protein